MASPERSHEVRRITSGPAPVDAVELGFDARALVALRSTVAAHADDLGLGADLLRDLVLVAHELATNAVRHGGGRGQLRLWRRGDRVYCQVRDWGGGLSSPGERGLSLPAPGTVGGRGLWIVRRLSEELRLRSGPDGTEATAVLVVGGSAGR